MLVFGQLMGSLETYFFNGFHPVFPWLGFLLLGIVLSRTSLKDRHVQIKLITWGLAAGTSFRSGELCIVWLCNSC